MTGGTAVLDDLEGRGLVHDTTDRAALAERLAAGPITLYYGMDPTRESVHVGNLIGLLVLRRFLAIGHHVIALAGGATGMVGDPSGRSDERNLLDEPTLRSNVEAIKGQIRRVLGNNDRWELVDNLDWTGDLRLLDFLRDVGKHATVNQMVARESVKQRMAGDHGISYTEFSYMLLQANDYWWLHEHRGCELQIGGSDQWGNILGGVDLVRRRSGHVVHALSWPLLTASDGSKLGKTTGATIWLDPARTSPYRFFQHFVNTDDRQASQFLAWFTLLPLAEIHQVMAEHARAPERRIAQRRLAQEVTTLVHGSQEATAAEAASSILFGGTLEGVDAAALAAVAAEVPTLDLESAELDAGVDLVDLLTRAGLAQSKSEARRTIAQGGASINGGAVTEGRAVGRGDLLAGRYVLLRRGKRSWAAIRCQVDTSTPGR